MKRQMPFLNINGYLCGQTGGQLYFFFHAAVPSVPFSFLFFFFFDAVAEKRLGRPDLLFPFFYFWEGIKGHY